MGEEHDTPAQPKREKSEVWLGLGLNSTLVIILLGTLACLVATGPKEASSMFRTLKDVQSQAAFDEIDERELFDIPVTCISRPTAFTRRGALQKLVDQTGMYENPDQYAFLRPDGTVENVYSIWGSYITRAHLEDTYCIVETAIIQPETSSSGRE